MEVLIALLGFLILARVLLATPFRGAVVLFLVLVGIHFIGRNDPQLAAALAPLLLTLFVVMVGYRLILKGLLG